MRLPLTVRWTTGAAVGETSTESRDVSSRGVYFFLSKDVREGSPVEILLTLPNEITLAGPVRVRQLPRLAVLDPLAKTRRIPLLHFAPACATRISTGFLLAHCGGGQDQPGCLGPSAKRPGSVFSFSLQLSTVNLCGEVLLLRLFQFPISIFHWPPRPMQAEVFLPPAPPARGAAR